MQSKVRSNDSIGIVHVSDIYHLAAVERAGIKSDDVEEVFFGNVLSAKYGHPMSPTDTPMST